MYAEKLGGTSSHTHVHMHTHTRVRTHILTEWKGKNSLLNFNVKSHFSHISYVFTPSVWLVYFLGNSEQKKNVKVIAGL